MADKKSSDGKHGGGHKDRDRNNPTDRKERDRAKQAEISKERGKPTSGGKPDRSGAKPKPKEDE